MDTLNLELTNKINTLLEKECINKNYGSDFKWCFNTDDKNTDKITITFTKSFDINGEKWNKVFDKICKIDPIFYLKYKLREIPRLFPNYTKCELYHDFRFVSDNWYYLIVDDETYNNNLFTDWYCELHSFIIKHDKKGIVFYSTSDSESMIFPEDTLIFKI